MSEENKRVVRRIFEEHYNRKNAELVGELFAPGASLHTLDGVFSGSDGVSALLQAYATAFPDFHLAIDELVAEGDRVVVRYGFAGTHRGPLGDIPATGRRVNVANGIGIYRLAAGKVTQGHFA